jgi:hypothetical protein
MKRRRGAGLQQAAVEYRTVVRGKGPAMAVMLWAIIVAAATSRVPLGVLQQK